MLDAHNQKCAARDFSQRRLGSLYEDVVQLLKVCDVHRAIIKNDLARLCSIYGRDNVEWIMKQIGEDQRSGHTNR